MVTSHAQPSGAQPSPPVDEHIVDIDVAAEMESSFLEYAYSVIYARALPDARDGLKPVQRRILYMMSDMGLRPDRPYVKSSRVVGEVMGKLHPHGDAAIYDALVRLAQDFSLRLPLVDGHGNFGSLDDGPAAPRYTEARLAKPAQDMTAHLDEDVVDFVPNYDNKLTQPEVLPSAIPNLLVNGASGIAVGMATNMAPHNLVEVVAAAQHLLHQPDASLEDIMRLVPGPDLPTGGRIVGLEGVRDAYRSGRGVFRTRATASIENVTARRKGIIITELPYLVGPEKVLEKIADGVKSKKIQGISAATDLTDRANGLRLVIEVKAGFDPEAVLEQLYRTTPLEDSFGINNVALVEGQPRTLGLRELLQVWVAHRLDVVRRRSAWRLARALDRLHLVEGLLRAIVDIDEVIQVIRSSDDAGVAKDRLMSVFDLSDAQAGYILDLQLRRLTKFSRLELEKEQADLLDRIAQLEKILGSDEVLRSVVSDEMGQVAATYGTPRRTVLIDSAGQAISGAGRGSGAGAGAGQAFGAGLGEAGSTRLAGAASGRRGKAAAMSLEIADSPTRVLLSSTGLLARVPIDTQAGAGAAEGGGAADLAAEAGGGMTGLVAGSADAGLARDGRRQPHDAIASNLATTARSDIGLVTSAGRIIRLPVVDLPSLPPTLGAPSVAGGVPAVELVDLAAGEKALAVVSLAPDAPTLALGTAAGVVKRVAAGDIPGNKEDWEVISLKAGDELIGAGPARDEDELVFVASDSSLLHYSASAVRPQGRSAAGMAGIKLAPEARAIFFGVARADVRPDLLVVTVAGAASALPGTGAGTAKVTPYELYPGKGRATGGVRSQRFLKGEDCLVLAWVGQGPARAVDSQGKPLDLTPVDMRRDGSGVPLAAPIASLG